MATTDDDRYHHFKLVYPKPTGRGAVIIEMDGQPLKGVRRLALSTAWNEANEITVTLIAGSINRPELEPLPRDDIQKAHHLEHVGRGVLFDDSCYLCTPTTAEEAGFSEEELEQERVARLESS